MNASDLREVADKIRAQIGRLVIGQAEAVDLVRHQWRVPRGLARPCRDDHRGMAVIRSRFASLM